MSPNQLIPIYNQYLNTNVVEPFTNKRLITLVMDPYSHFNHQSSLINTSSTIQNNFTEFKTYIEVGDFITVDDTQYTVNTYGKSTNSINGQYTTDYSNQMVNSSNTINPSNGKTGATNILKLDRIYDVYLESLTTFNCVANTSSKTMGFFLNINDWSIHNNSNMSNRLNTIFIPNEATSTGITTVHKAKKSNFITSLTPRDITDISGYITCMDGSTIFDNPNKPGAGPSQGRIIIEFLLIPREKA